MNRKQHKSPHKPTLTADPSCLSATTNYMHVYHVHCATDSTLTLAMSTQPGDRAAEGTEVYRFNVSLSVRGWTGLIAAEIRG